MNMSLEIILTKYFSANLNQRRQLMVINTYRHYAFGLE